MQFDYTSKKCSACQILLPLTSFCKDKNRKDGHSYVCRKCASIRAIDRRKRKTDNARTKELWHSKPKDHPSKLKKYASNRKRRRAFWYGITEEQWQEMLVKQDNKCDICGVDLRELTGKKINLDHCHATGLIRGILCFSCNILLANAKDNIRILESAISYLQKEFPPRYSKRHR